MTRQEKILNVLAKLDVIRQGAQHNLDKATGPADRIFENGVLFAITIAQREVKSLLPKPKKI